MGEKIILFLGLIAVYVVGYLRLWKKGKKVLCLTLSLLLLFSIDCFYHERQMRYIEINADEYLVAEYKNETSDKRMFITVCEFDSTEYGSYYRIYASSSGANHMGLFRVFKEKGVEYETPIIVEEENSCKIIIKRKSSKDLVYAIPYHRYKGGEPLV